ncbi:uncharacterized protein LOC125488837 [Plutella xylostella]|uniref:uncharacterized protein LOC125488837 n=1 Tax=Plutella xylostella TaxID=51655 RepID=UPI002032251C|nr:uncharacterized protein LOC125488837 [Plutella xylostella]
MNKEEGIVFLFDIVKTVKFFYENPVILFTKKDFSDVVFNTLCEIRKALLENASLNEVSDIIVESHIQWLHAVKDIENVKNNENLKRDDVYTAIEYTLNALCSRLKYLQRYVDKYRPYLSNEQQEDMRIELEIIHNMHDDAVICLSEKLKCFKSFIGDVEFEWKTIDQINQLLEWLDEINDASSMVTTKYFTSYLPNLNENLTKTLQRVVEDFIKKDSPSSHDMLKDLNRYRKQLGSLVRYVAEHSREMYKITALIKTVEKQLSEFGDETPKHSPVLKQVLHKKKYLEERLEHLEKIKTTIEDLHSIQKIPSFEGILDKRDLCMCEDFYQLRIFNHSLPPVERQRLVTELCHLWNVALYGVKKNKSFISIFNEADANQEFEDELGRFYVDAHSRKIYVIPDLDEKFQQNENNELVPLSDDANHVYFYDSCGRYYIDELSRRRIYKALETESEYMMNTNGELSKVKEVRDGTMFYFDTLGRYYINDEGQHIYRDEDSLTEYECDDFGNLVRICSRPNFLNVCPEEINATKESKYLQETVGKALSTCITDVILHQPEDPIKYLAEALFKYRENIERKEICGREKEALMVEREIRAAEDRAEAERKALELAMTDHEGSEATDLDSNMLRYKTMESTVIGSPITDT